MNYKVVENILSNIYQFAFDNKIIVAVLWIAAMFFLLRKLSKRDNEFYAASRCSKKFPTGMI